nr:hypothetical protein [Tanacetum cinerariifolium]
MGEKADMMAFIEGKVVGILFQGSPTHPKQLLAEGEEREEALPTVEGQAKALAESKHESQSIVHHGKGMSMKQVVNSFVNRSPKAGSTVKKPNRKEKNSIAIHEGASGKSREAPCHKEGPRKVKSSALIGVKEGERMRNHLTVKEGRREFDRPKPNKTAKKSPIWRPVRRGEDGRREQRLSPRSNSSHTKTFVDLHLTYFLSLHLIQEELRTVVAG